ncbi:MAG: peptidyl-prolyl cis-trans isomerase, partial [Nitrospirota bacterium]|nr:peptidyl-prolyl cis-trans isomerase [Nitrospirota bacterium]
KRKLETERDSLRRQLQDLDTRSTKAKDVLSQLEESRKKQEELSKFAALNDKEIAKLRAEKSDLETRLKDIEERAKVLSGIKQRDERTTAEMRDLEQRLTEERAKFDADTQTIRAERDELKKQLGVLEALRKDKEELAARLDETKRLYADAQGKGGQAEKILQDNRILNNEKKQLEIRLSSSEEKIAALTSQRDKGAVLESERKDLAARFDEQEKKIKEQQSLISRLMIEKGGMEKDLKDGKQEIATAKALKESRDLLQLEVDRMRIEQKQMKADLDEMKRMNEQHATRNADLIREVSTLRTQSLDFEKPFLRIGKERYDLAAVMSEGRTARNVTDKIQVKNVPWRTGNIIDDFITEQILARKAQEGASSGDASVKESLVKQYALNAPEGVYLGKYLAIDGLIRKRFAAPAISEKEAREYYEKHTDQYVQGRDNRIRVLSVKYGKADELEKSIIAVEIMQEVQDGRTFDTVARRRAAVAVMKEMSLSRLPDWAHMKIAGLKEGEISNIISLDNEFMIIQAISSKPAYRSFEEVRNEIEKKLSAEQSGRKESLQDWLNSLRKDVEFLR